MTIRTHKMPPNALLKVLCSILHIPYVMRPSKALYIAETPQMLIPYTETLSP